MDTPRGANRGDAARPAVAAGAASAGDGSAWARRRERAMSRRTRAVLAGALIVVFAVSATSLDEGSDIAAQVTGAAPESARPAGAPAWASVLGRHIGLKLVPQGEGEN